MLVSSSAMSPAVIPSTARVGLRWWPRATEIGNIQIGFWSLRRLGRRSRQETSLSGVILAMGGDGRELGESTSGASAARGNCSDVFCAAHRCVTPRAVNSKIISQNFMVFAISALHNFNKDFRSGFLKWRPGRPTYYWFFGQAPTRFDLGCGP